MKENALISVIILFLILSSFANSVFGELSNENNSINNFEDNIFIEYPVMINPIDTTVFNNEDNPIPISIIDTPKEYNWRNYDGKDWTTPAKNQGNCGSCWDFAAIGTLESIIKIRENRPEINPDLSEQYVLSCLPAAANYYGEGCLGGTPYGAFYYMMNNSEEGNNYNGGIPESCFPYQASDDIPCSDKCENWIEYLIPIADCGETWLGFDSAYLRDTIKSLIYEKGPISAGMNVTQDFIRYWQLHHNEENYYPDTNEPWGNRLNHIIIIIGWKDDDNIDNGGYWICKNSWGADWGYNGFFNIEYGGLFTGSYIAWVDYIYEDQRPSKPTKPTGVSDGNINIEYNYSSSCIDPNEDQVFYLFNWGDSPYSDWIGPYESGEIAEVSHIWNKKGNYEIKVKARDIHNYESEWSDPLPVNMPKQKKPSVNSNDDWYYYPKLQNYAPFGMPDFDQKQNNWKDTVYKGWTFCGAVSVSNIFWYIDSLYSDNTGTPGDGNDSFPVVLDYHAQGESNPGPNTDDHNTNNANDLTSTWDQKESIYGNELVERIAWYVDTNGCRTNNEIWGTNLLSMYSGVLKWLDDVGLSQYFQVEMIFPSQSYLYNSFITDVPHVSINNFDNTQGRLYDPNRIFNIKKSPVILEDLTFHNLALKVMNGSFVVLGINGVDDDKNVHFSHWVTVAGVSLTQSKIALSDPYFDVANRTSNPILHNDPAFVSHDIYTVNTTCPFPEGVNYFWLEGYLPNLYSISPAALIITPLSDNITDVSPISFFIKPDEGFIFVNEKHIINTIFGNTIIFGDIAFEVNAFSDEGIDSIEFYVNNDLKYVDDEFPYAWFWNDKSFGKYNIKIKAIDSGGDITENHMKVWRFF